MKKVECKKGCVFCCYNMQIHVYENEGKTFEAIEKVINEVTYEKMPANGGKTFSPCPLLNLETKECRIYNERPVECSSYYSSDVKACKTSLDNIVYRGVDTSADTHVIRDQRGFVLGRRIEIRELIKQLKDEEQS